MRKSLIAALCALAVLLSAGSGAAMPEFFFHDGDRVVVIGDSITVQGDYGRYIENFVRTRFPAWNVIFRNAGINGHTAEMGMPYIENDVLLWQPTVAIVNWGMNDGRRRGGVEYYQRGIVPYVDRLLESNVRVVLCSNSPLDIGDEPGNYTNHNAGFHEMARFAEDLARRRGLPFVDQFHFCHTLWGENRKREKPVPVSDQTLAKHASDPVHARAPGQLIMAYIILKTLRAPAEVSHASLDAKTGAARTRRCRISDFADREGMVSFVRADEASPCWIDDLGALAFDLVPFQSELNLMTLQVAGLPPRIYEVRIEGQACGRFTADALARGINLSEDRKSPVHGPGRKVDDLVLRLKGATAQAREILRFQPPAWLKIPDLDEQKKREFSRRFPDFEKLDAAIAAAAQPAPLRYEIVPMEGR